MKTREEIIRLLAENKTELKKRFKVQRIALFGSYARGDQREESDVDILVDVDPSIGLEFVILAERIEKLLGLRVELVSRKAIKHKALEMIEQELVYV